MKNSGWLCSSDNRSSVATQITPPGLVTRAISRIAVAAASCPPKCSIEESDQQKSNASFGKGSFVPSAFLKMILLFAIVRGQYLLWIC